MGQGSSYPPSSGVRRAQRNVPTTGQTVTVGTGVAALVLEPAGLLAALTVAMPSSPIDGQCLAITCTQIVTALTMSGGTIVSALTALTANGFAEWIYIAASTTWYRIG